MGAKKFLGWLGLFFFISAVCLIPLSGVSAAERKEILVGAVTSLTGSSALTGAEQKWAYEQAVDDVNKKGGVYVKELGRKLPIKLIFADDKGTPDKAAEEMEKLIKLEKIDFALSGIATQYNIGAAIVAEKYKVYYAITCSWLDQIAKENFKWASDFFVTADSAARVPYQIWKTFPEADKIKRPGLLMLDVPDGQIFRESFKKWAKEYGYTIILDETYTMQAQDFSAPIMKMKATNLDALLFLGGPPTGITVVRQMKENNLNLKYLHGWAGFWPGMFAKTMGKDADYIIHDGFWSEDLPYPMAKEIGQRYAKQFGRDSVSIGLYYANPQILAMAIEKAGSIDSAKVRNAVFGGEFKGTIMGDLKFNEKGLCETNSLALQWWQGQRKPFWPPVKGGWQVKMLPPWDKR